MKRFLSLCCLVFISFFIVVTVNAYTYSELPEDAQDAFENFIYYLNSGDVQIYEILDSSDELNGNINQYLNAINIKYEILDVTTVADNHYKIEARIVAEGIGWNVSGFTTYYEVKLIDNEYKIVDTNLFDVVGTDNVMKFCLKIFAIIGGIIFSVFLIIIIILVVVIVKGRKKKDNLSNQQNNVY